VRPALFLMPIRKSAYRRRANVIPSTCRNVCPDLRKSLVRAFFVFALTLPAHAVGTEDETDAPPAPSETTTACDEGQIFDDDQGKCVAPEDATDDQAALYRDMRELALAGRLVDASRVLDVLEPTDRVMTYRGFIARQRGDWTTAEAHYVAALTMNPDNLLARSYYGMGLAERGDVLAAKDQLAEIRARGGRQTWPERALVEALRGVRWSY